ncbi:hypothetical protein CEP53_014992, partial [Fusarium sp. AF-6]
MAWHPHAQHRQHNAATNISNNITISNIRKQSLDPMSNKRRSLELTREAGHASIPQVEGAPRRKARGQFPLLVHLGPLELGSHGRHGGFVRPAALGAGVERAGVFWSGVQDLKDGG